MLRTEQERQQHYQEKESEKGGEYDGDDASCHASGSDGPSCAHDTKDQGYADHEENAHGSAGLMCCFACFGILEK